MCGIFGVFNYSKREPVDREAMKRSTDTIAHRGPDGEGFYYDDPLGLGFGHRRLSIIDLSTGDQPISNEDNTVWLIFNGEIYNYTAIKEILVKKGHQFKTRTDGEVIIHAYEEFGTDCSKLFNGIFAFAIWDRRKEQLFLSRDHYGVKPLYYLNDGIRIVFSSEIKAILAYTGLKPEINLNALSACLSFRHTPAPNTLFEGIYKIPASYSLTITTRGNCRLFTYWNSPLQVYKQNRNVLEITEILQERFKEAVHRQMMSDVPIGISLSGGIDSGSILSVMSAVSNSSIHAFTVGFENVEPKLDELAQAEKNARLFNAEFNYYKITEKDYIDFFRYYIYHLEEPNGNESAPAYYFVAKLANKKVKVLLNGQGADELFSGYDRYMGLYYTEFFPRIFPLLVQESIWINKDENRLQQLGRLKEVFSQKEDKFRILAAGSLLSKNTLEILQNSSLPLINYRELSDDPIQQEFLSRLDGNLVERLFMYDMFNSLSENLLLSEDKMSMAASIEARVPFLDLELSRYALTLPASVKISNFRRKYIHKRLCSKFLPHNVVHQHKIGFDSPMNVWFENYIGLQLKELISRPHSMTREYLNPEAVDQLITEHERTAKDHSKFLFLLFSLEVWKETFLD